MFGDHHLDNDIKLFATTSTGEHPRTCVDLFVVSLTEKIIISFVGRRPAQDPLNFVAQVHVPAAHPQGGASEGKKDQTYRIEDGS
jgi:hypothetical protein